MADLPEGFALDQQPDAGAGTVAGTGAIPTGFTVDQPQAQPTIGSVAKQAAIGIPEGLLGTLKSAYGAMTGEGFVEPLVRAMADPETAAKVHEASATGSLDRVLSAIGLNPADYPAQNAPEHIARFTGNMASNALLPGVGTPGVLGRIGDVAASTIGGLTGGVAAEAVPEQYRPYAEFAGALVGHGAARRTIPVGRATAPTQTDLEQAAQNQYQAAKGFGVELDPQSTSNLADQIKTDLTIDGFRELNQPQTFRTIDELKDPYGPNVTVSDIDSVRKALNRVGKSPDASEREGARRAIAAIDDYMANLTPADALVNGHFIPRLQQVMTDARSNYAAARRAETIEDAMTRAQDQAGRAGTGANIDNATRQQISRILNSRTLSRGFSQDEVDTMRQIVRGTFTGNAFRWLGRLAPTGIVSGGLGLGLGHLAGVATGAPLGAAAAVPAVGYVAKRTADALTASRVNQLLQNVRARSALGAAAPPAPQVPAIRYALPALQSGLTPQKRGGRIRSLKRPRVRSAP